MEYDVYYSTGGLNMIGGGADVWVNKWLEMIPQHLKTESKVIDPQNKSTRSSTRLSYGSSLARTR